MNVEHSPETERCFTPAFNSILFLNEKKNQFSYNHSHVSLLLASEYQSTHNRQSECNFQMGLLNDFDLCIVSI